MKSHHAHNILIAETEDDDLYRIEAQQTPNGQRFRVVFESFGLDYSDLAPGYLWDPDPIPAIEIVKRGKWVSTVLEAVSRLPENWVEFAPVEVAPEYAFELWQLFQKRWKTPSDDAANANHQRWKQLLKVESPQTTAEAALPNPTELQTILELAGEGGGYVIQAISTPGGPQYRLKSSDMEWDPDSDGESWATQQGKWKSSLDEVFAELNPSWFRLFPTAAHPEHAAALWGRYLGAIRNAKNAPPRNISIWSEVLMGKQLTQKEATAIFTRAASKQD